MALQYVDPTKEYLIDDKSFAYDEIPVTPADADLKDEANTVFVARALKFDGDCTVNIKYPSGKTRTAVFMQKGYNVCGCVRLISVTPSTTKVWAIPAMVEA